MTQILVTIVVAVAALLFARARNRPAEPPQSRRPMRAAELPVPNWLTSNASRAGYSLLALLVVGALLVFWFQWQAANEVVSVRVVDGSTGTTTVYEVLRKHLGGREFETIDGRFVSLGVGDRMELSSR